MGHTRIDRNIKPVVVEDENHIGTCSICGEQVKLPSVCASHGRNRIVECKSCKTTLNFGTAPGICEEHMSVSGCHGMGVKKI